MTLRRPNSPPYRRVSPNVEHFLWPIGLKQPWWWPAAGEDLAWSSVGSLAVPRGCSGAFRFSQKIYTCGGTTPSPGAWLFDTVEEFDVQTYQSIVLPNLKLPKDVNLPVVAGSSKFYVIDGVYFGKACYEINSPAGPWNKQADMPQGQHCQTAAAGPDGKIYIIGGIKPSPATYLNIVQCFDPGNGTWSQVHPLNSPRFGAAAATAAGKIYIFGGIDDQAKVLTSVEEYDPVTNQWTVLSEPMPTPRYDLAAVTGSNGRIYVIGGMYQCSSIDVVEEFDPTTKLWRVMTPMPTARWSAAAAATTDGRIFVLGGFKKVAGTSSATGVIEQAVLPTV